MLLSVVGFITHAHLFVGLSAPWMEGGFTKNRIDPINFWSRSWLRGRAGIILLEGSWFDSPGLHVEVSLGKRLSPKLLLMCWSAPCMAVLNN